MKIHWSRRIVVCQKIRAFEIEIKGELHLFIMTGPGL